MSDTTTYCRYRSQGDTPICKNQMIFEKWLQTEGIKHYSLDVLGAEELLINTIEASDYPNDIEGVIALIDLGYLSSIGYLAPIGKTGYEADAAQIWEDIHLCRMYGVLSLKYFDLGFNISQHDYLDSLKHYAFNYIDAGARELNIWQFFLLVSLAKRDAASGILFSNNFHTVANSDIADVLEILARLCLPEGNLLMRDLAGYMFLDSDYSDNQYLDMLLLRDDADQIRNIDYAKLLVDNYYMHGRRGNNLLSSLRYARNIRSPDHRKVLENHLMKWNENRYYQSYNSRLSEVPCE
jgi:hypothetical protein